MPSRHRVLVNDSQLSLLQCGPVDGPVALFLHGIPTGAELWRDVLVTLAERGYRCLAPDLIGFGQTIVPDTADHSILASAHLLRDWIEQEDLNSIWLISHDIGGGVGQLLLTACEDRFLRCSISNSITADTWPVPMIRLMRIAARLGLFAPLAATGIMSTWVGRFLLGAAVHDRSVLTDDVLSRVFWDTKVTTPEGRLKIQKLLAALDSTHTQDNMEKLKSVGVPIDLIWAMNDPYQPWHGSGILLNQIFPKARVVHLQQAGHFLQIDAPEKYSAALLDDTLLGG